MMRTEHFEAYHRVISAIGENVRRNAYSEELVPTILADVKKELDQCLGLGLFSEDDYQELDTQLATVSREFAERLKTATSQPA